MSQILLWPVSLYVDQYMCFIKRGTNINTAGGTVMLGEEGAISKLFPQSWEHGLVQNLLV